MSFLLEGSVYVLHNLCSKRFMEHAKNGTECQELSQHFWSLDASLDGLFVCVIAIFCSFFVFCLPFLFRIFLVTTDVATGPICCRLPCQKSLCTSTGMNIHKKNFGYSRCHARILKKSFPIRKLCVICIHLSIKLRSAP